MKVDLSEKIIFDVDTISFDKQINFVYGKNGTGKSTLCKLIKKQYGLSMDVRIFQGFEKLLGEDEKLNAVLLGKENIKINKKINDLENEIEKRNKEKENKKSQIMEPENPDEENLYTKYKKSKWHYEKQNNKIENFKSTAAKYIKNINNPQIAKPTYNKNDLEIDIKKANRLDSADIEKLKNILKSDIKKATFIDAKADYKLSELLLKINRLLTKKVEEEIIIKRIDNNEKRNFAESGLKIHKAGDYCAFCGNKISDETIIELKRYFDVDKVKRFETEIVDFIRELKLKKDELNKIKLDSAEFYSDYQDEVIKCMRKIENIISKYEEFLDRLISALNKKRTRLFSETDEMKLYIPEDIKEVIDSYNEIVKSNNESELELKQKNAKHKLRHHYVKLKLDKFDYDVACNELKNRELNKNVCKKDIDKVTIEINQIVNEIKNINAELIDSHKGTISEEILAENINKNLKDYVDFELIYCGAKNNKGYYQVKDLQTVEVREITKLSKGEKNIIAFLYFLETLDDINKKTNKQRVIVFDDPMTSNDDTMQYIMMIELQNLMKNLNDSEVFVLLTHNAHFYINVSWYLKNDYKKYSFYRFISNGFETKVEKINKKEDDLKTSYSGLWYDLKYLYNDEKCRPEILHNIIRRIIETYCKFNVIKENEFYEDTPEARKFFNVNSHSIDDLDIDLNGRSKKEIMKVMKKCFYKKNAQNHFDAHWNNIEQGKLK